jgi:hypothetical protein
VRSRRSPPVRQSSHWKAVCVDQKELQDTHGSRQIGRRHRARNAPHGRVADDQRRLQPILRTAHTPAFVQQSDRKICSPVYAFPAGRQRHDIGPVAPGRIRRKVTANRQGRHPHRSTSSQLCGGVALPYFFFLLPLDGTSPITGHSHTCLPGMKSPRRLHLRSAGLYISRITELRVGRSAVHGQMRKREYGTGLSINKS